MEFVKAAEGQRNRIEGRYVVNGWSDENGRKWDTVDDHPILTGHDQEPQPADPGSRGDLSHDVPGLKKFLLAGSATVTLVSKKTGARHTFRVRADTDVWWVDVLKGPNDYGYIGQMSKRGARHRYYRGRKCWPSYFKQSDVFAWFVRHLFGEDTVSPHLEVWHEGKCGRCGRKLTVPDSIKTGLGPECAGKV